MTDYPSPISSTLSKAGSGVLEPHRVAIIQDWGVGLQPLYDQYDATQLAFDEATEYGLLDRPVELKVIEVEGLPYARATTMLEAVDTAVHEFQPLPDYLAQRICGPLNLTAQLAVPIDEQGDVAKMVLLGEAVSDTTGGTHD